jgi:GNAT superfamily N-acetyltransferase
MSDKSRLLMTDETGEASGVLSRAFFDDPLQKYILPGQEERRTRSAPLFEFILKYGCLYGEVYTLDAGISGAAVWMKPRGWEMNEEGMTKAGFEGLAAAIGEDAFNRFGEFFGYIEQYHHRDAAMDHWYLAVIGVDPVSQGKGVGGSIIAPTLRRADAAGIHCYLETAQPKNIPMYEHFGFKVLVDEVEPKSGVRFWTFLREPQR